MADIKYVLSTNTPSTVELSGTYDFRQGILALPTGSTPPTAIGSNISFIKNSGVIALWDGSAWKTLSAGGGLPAVFDDAVIWMDLGAGSASGTSPTSVVENPSGHTTGTFHTTAPTYTEVSGNNTWTFPDNSANQMYDFDYFNFADDGPWVKSVAYIFKMGALGDANRSFWSYANSQSANANFALNNSSTNNAFEVRYGASTADTTYQADNKDDACLAVFVVLSGTRSGANSLGSGCFYVGKNTFEINFSPLTNIAPVAAYGRMGDAGTTNSAPCNVFGFLSWNRAITKAEMSDIIDYYAGRGIEVL